MVSGVPRLRSLVPLWRNWRRTAPPAGRRHGTGHMASGHLALLLLLLWVQAERGQTIRGSSLCQSPKARWVGGFWPPASPSPGHDSREAASAPPSNFVLTPPAYMLSRCTSHICHVHFQQNNVFRPFSGIHQAVYCLLTWEVFLLTHEDAVQSQDKPGGSHSTWTRALLGNSEYYKVQCRGNFRLSGLVSVAFFFPVN